MKKLALLLVLSMLPVLAFAQDDSSIASTQQSPGLVNNGCVTLLPNSRDLGREPVGFSSPSKPFYLLNGCAVNLIVDNITAVGGAFTQTNNCIGTLAPNNFCEIDVVFTPTSRGVANQNLTINYHKQGNPNELQIQGGISGTGINDMSFEPSSNCDFGSVYVGTEGFCTITLQNEEPQRLTIGACNVNSFPPFSQDTACPAYLAKKGNNGDSVTITLDFRPISVGVFEGTFAVTTDSPQEQQSGNPYSAVLTGIGIPHCIKGICPPSD